MRKSLKAIALLSAALMTASAALTGCASGGTASSANGESAATTGQKTKISYWSFHTNEEKTFMASLGEKYSKVNPNVEVDYQNFPEADYMGTKLTTAFAADAGPDVFVMSSGDFLKYANSGVAMDLTPYFTDKIKNDFLQSTIDGVSVDNKIMGIPFEVELLGLYYNKDMFKAANLNPPKTWDELVSDTKALTKDKVAGLIAEPSKGYYQNFTWYPFLWQTGANVLDAQKKVGTFDSEGAQKALKLWGDLVKAGAPSKLSIPLSNDVSLLGQGQAAMQICGTWAIPTLEQKYPKTNIGLVPLPIPDGGTAKTCAGGWKILVNSKSKNADAAAKFAMWAFAEDINVPLEWCTKVKFAYSPRKSVVEAGKSVYNQGLRKVFTDEIYSSAIPEPRYPAEIVNAVGDALQNVMLNNGDPKKETETADQKINDFLKTYNGSL